MLTPLLLAVLAGAPGAAPISRGDPAPALESATPEGHAVAAGWSNGEATVVAFFATWCKPCHRALRELGAIRQAIGPRLRFVLVEAGDDPAEVRQFLAENPAPEGAVVATDLTGVVRERWGCTSYPSLFIVDHGGIVRYVNHGWGEGSQAKYLRRLHDVLHDAPPPGIGRGR
jgi:cytochrome c biogenesis protein CcmG, thiol:disulfide interchange protein DsbE